MELDMVEKFLMRIAEALKAAGFADTKVRYEEVHVNGCRFGAEVSNKRNRVKFLGSGFKVTGDPDDEQPIEFDVGKAVGLLIAELPKRMELAQKAAQLKDHKEAVYAMSPGATSYVDENNRFKEWREVAPGIRLGFSPHGVQVLFTSTDMGRIAKALEVLKTC